jgi:hypothetical protein
VDPAPKSRARRWDGRGIVVERGLTTHGFSWLI